MLLTVDVTGSFEVPTALASLQWWAVILGLRDKSTTKMSGYLITDTGNRTKTVCVLLLVPVQSKGAVTRGRHPLLAVWCWWMSKYNMAP